MNIYQDLSGLTPGAYRLSCLSMCGPNEITDQHAFMIAQGDTTLSPVKRVAIWNTDEGWEQQTTEPVVVGTDGTLRVGYETAKTAALTVADTEDYSDDARANLRALVQAQADIITTLRVQASVDDLTRQLQQRTDDVRKTRKPGLDTDFSFLTAVPVEGNTTTSGSLGRGWNEITVDNITVSDNTMTIGFSNDSYFTGKPRFSGTWFSIDDFQLYYLSASTPTTIHTINTLAPQSHTTYYTASGMKVERPEGHGLFIVRRNNAVVKILR